MDKNTPMKPFMADEQCTVFNGDSLAIMRSLPSESFDAIVTDPPYSSGGLFSSARAKSTSEKYVLTGTQKQYPEFFGDNRDQRSFLIWSSIWLSEAFRLTKPGGYLLVFSDWRQLPSTTDAVQVGGWIWKGIVVWDKTEGTRPSRGWFRSQAEYVVGATRGPIPGEQHRKVKCCLPGVFRENVRPAEKRHMTGKPVALMKNLLKVLPPKSVILDPFAGSGTTLVAAQALGHKSTGIELSKDYCSVILDRLGAKANHGATFDEIHYAGRN